MGPDEVGLKQKSNFLEPELSGLTDEGLGLEGQRNLAYQSLEGAEPIWISDGNVFRHGFEVSEKSQCGIVLGSVGRGVANEPDCIIFPNVIFAETEDRSILEVRMHLGPASAAQEYWVVSCRFGAEAGKEIGRISGSNLDNTYLTCGESIVTDGGRETGRIRVLLTFDAFTNYSSAAVKEGKDATKRIVRVNGIAKNTDDRTASDRDAPYDRLCVAPAYYRLEHTEAIQDGLLKVIERGRAEGRIVLPSKTDFYMVAQGSSPSMTAEEFAGIKHRNPVEAIDALLVTLHNAWRENLLAFEKSCIEAATEVPEFIGIVKNAGVVHSKDQILSLHRDHRQLSQVSPFYYQGANSNGREPESSFVHVRIFQPGYESMSSTLRLYMQPQLEYVPEVAKHLINYALNQNESVHFKFADSGFGGDRRLVELLQRRDGVVIYTNETQAKRLLNSLRSAELDHPEWFQRSTFPDYCATAMKGIGIGASTNHEQDAKFGKCSFTQLRALMVQSAWHSAAIDLISDMSELPDSSERTPHQRVVSVLDELMSGNSTVDGAQRALSSEDLFQIGKQVRFDPGQMLNLVPVGQVRSVMSAFSQVALECTASLPAQRLHRLLAYHVQELCPKYGIDSQNISNNRW